MNTFINPEQNAESPLILKEVKNCDKSEKLSAKQKQAGTKMNIKFIDLTVSASEDNLLVDDLDDDIFIS